MIENRTAGVRTALLLTLLLAFTSATVPALAQQKIHEEYTRKILEFTTDPCFTTKYVNYLPYAEGIPRRSRSSAISPVRKTSFPIRPTSTSTCGPWPRRRPG